MIVEAALGIALAALIVMIVEAFLAYGRLPSRVPLHFDWRGAPGSYGPKALFVGIFAAIALSIVIPLATGTLTGEERDASAIIAAAALALTAFTQHAIIDAVLKRDGRLAIRPFYVVSAMLISVCIIAAQLHGG